MANSLNFLERTSLWYHHASESPKFSPKLPLGQTVWKPEPQGTSPRHGSQRALRAGAAAPHVLWGHCSHPRAPLLPALLSGVQGAGEATASPALRELHRDSHLWGRAPKASSGARAISSALPLGVLGRLGSLTAVQLPPGFAKSGGRGRRRSLRLDLIGRDSRETGQRAERTGLGDRWQQDEPDRFWH